MLLTLIRREIVGNVLSFRFLVTFLLFFGLVLVSVFVMTTDYQDRSRAYEASLAGHRESLDKIGAAGDANQVADELFLNQGIYGDRRPQDLGVFVDGLAAVVPTQVHTAQFNARTIDEQRYRNPVLALFDSPDLGYVVNIVVSLLALMFVFDAICGEKERGTLKIVLANAVPRDSIILGKWIGGFVSLTAPFLVSLAAGIGYVHLIGAITLDGESLARIGWFVVVSLLYISLFFTLGLLISTLTHRASTALIVSLFVWICWILVIPNLAPVIARIAYPVPSAQKITAEKMAVDQETQLKLQRISQQTLSYGDEGRRLQEEITQEGEARQEKLDRFYREEFATQTSVSKTLSRLSPAASYRYATTELAATGISSFIAFRQAHERFEEEFDDFADGVNEQRNNQGRLPDGWYEADQLPQFHIIESRLDDTINGLSIDLLLLLVYNVLFFMGSYLFFLRYDVT
ncbi:MAG: ABC transporter permease subunit [Gemmatimonadetes bacterium]|nr:ABC transporter permease subunit [Gemmatimonadota bacterium]MBT5963490.1 ABC transporter permease subunit [Gemmatimonadota bacterium]MBT7454509.1 ABC transporter permease subunit [Gemmatimonadota bacterium]